MLEFMLCSLVTLLPDYLIRRFVQGKRIGKEITLYSVWYELRYGIVSCAMLTISLITAIYYYHPATTNITSFFRTVTILPEAPGRVTDVYITNGQHVEAGVPLFKVDDSVQRASVAAAQSRVQEVNASMIQAESELAAAQGALDQADSALKQAQEELDTRMELYERNSNVVSDRDIERMENVVAEREGAVGAALANREAIEARITTLLPAQLRTASADLEQMQAQLNKTITYAMTSGTVQQFALQPGDIVNPLLRPAGILVPDGLSGIRLQGGFSQISAQVIKPGMLAEVVCFSKPLDIIPMVVTDVQRVIAAGQFRPTDQLLDAEQRAAPGTLTVALEPLYSEDIEKIPPGSKCIGNAYTSNHERLHTEDLGTLEYIFLHGIDTVGIAHAAILRIQAVMMPVQTLVLSGHH